MSDVKPWELRTESDRTADTVYNFIVFCEDEACEPNYVRHFQRSNINIHFKTNRQGKHKQELLVYTQLEDDKQLDYKDGKIVGLKFDEGTQVWCIYDRDKNKDGTPSTQHDMDFTASITNLENIGVKVAWSHDAFELWILVHFEDVVLNDPDYTHRQKYYERLTAIFKNLTFTPEYQKVVDSVDFNYKGAMKKAHKFIPMVLPNLKGKTEIAIERAKALAEHHHAAPSFHEMAPCTMMHKLVEELIKLA